MLLTFNPNFDRTHILKHNFFIFFIQSKRYIMDCSFEVLDLETGRERLLQLLSLFLISDNQGVQEARASYLELDIVGVLLYLDALCVLPPRLQEEVFDLLNFPRHGTLL